MKLRTIKGAIREIKAIDPDTAITEYRIRQLLQDGLIKGKRNGSRWVLDIDALIQYYQSP